MWTKLPLSWMGTTVALALLAVFEKAFGAFAPGTYRDPLWTASQLRGADAVALFTLVPLLAISAVWAARGSPRGRLLLGC